MYMGHIFISIGYNCDPRMYLRWEHNLQKSNGYLSCPFDLCVTSYEAFRKCIDTNFEHFFDDLRLIPGPNATGDRSLCGKGEQNITNAYGMVFNHEGSTHSHQFKEGKNDDEFFIRDNFKEFRLRYSMRIQNYLDYINTYNEITFVYNPDPALKNMKNEPLEFLTETYTSKIIQLKSLG